MKGKNQAFPEHIVKLDLFSTAIAMDEFLSGN